MSAWMMSPACRSRNCAWPSGDFAATMNAVPVLAARPGLDVEYYELLERKDEDRIYRTQPRRRIDLAA